MAIESIGESEEVAAFEYERSYRDVLAATVTKLASLSISPFWRVQQSLHSSVLPLHSGEYGQSRSNIQEMTMRLFWGMFKVPTLISLGHIPRSLLRG